MFELNKLNHSIISQEDNPKLKSTRSNSYITNVMFDYDNLVNPKGDVLRVTSVLTDSEKNTYFRYIDILVYFEQTHYVEIDDNILSSLLHDSIINHSKDLGLSDTKKIIPSIQKIKNFIDSL